MGRPKKYESFDVAGLAPHVIQTTGGCWEWQGARNKDGYGAVGIRDGNQRVHRLSYEANIGPIGDMCVLHSCDNPPCCNADHLFLGTRKQNMADMVAKGRQGRNGNQNKTHCIKGHPFSTENTFINLKGSRVCLTCKRAANVSQRLKRKVAA